MESAICPRLQHLPDGFCSRVVINVKGQYRYSAFNARNGMFIIRIKLLLRKTMPVLNSFNMLMSVTLS